MHGEKIHAYGMHKLEQVCAHCRLAVRLKDIHRTINRNSLWNGAHWFNLISEERVKIRTKQWKLDEESGGAIRMFA